MANAVYPFSSGHAQIGQYHLAQRAAVSRTAPIRHDFEPEKIHEASLKAG